MKDLKLYLPSPRLIVGVLIVLAVTTLVLRQFAGNATVSKIGAYLGLYV